MAGIGVQDHRNHCSGSRNPRSRSRNRCSRWIGISVQDGPEYALVRLNGQEVIEDEGRIEGIPIRDEPEEKQNNNAKPDRQGRFAPVMIRS